MAKWTKQTVLRRAPFPNASYQWRHRHVADLGDSVIAGDCSTERLSVLICHPGRFGSADQPCLGTWRHEDARDGKNAGVQSPSRCGSGLTRIKCLPKEFAIWGVILAWFEIGNMRAAHGSTVNHFIRVALCSRNGSHPCHPVPHDHEDGHRHKHGSSRDRQQSITQYHHDWSGQIFLDRPILSAPSTTAGRRLAVQVPQRALGHRAERRERKHHRVPRR